MHGERRRFYRHSFSFPLYIEKEKDSPILTHSVDLSMGGIGFMWTRSIPSGTPVTVTIKLGESPVYLEARVIYSRGENSNRTGELYRIGAVFHNPPFGFREKLAEEILRVVVYQNQFGNLNGHPISEEEAARRYREKTTATI